MSQCVLHPFYIHLRAGWLLRIGFLLYKKKAFGDGVVSPSSFEHKRGQELPLP